MTRAHHDRMTNAIRALAMDAVEAGQIGPPRSADGRRRHRDGAVHAGAEIRSGRSDLARPRPLRALGRPRLDAGLCAAASARLRVGDARPDQEIPPARLDDARPSGEFHHRRHRDHHRPARPGSRQRRRHGDRRAASRGRVRRRRRQSFDLCARLRRRPDGRHQPGGDRARRPSEAQQARRAVRRQRHFHRRAAVAVGLGRSGEALRGGRLERLADRRSRSRGHRRRDREGKDVRQADHDRLQDHHRLWRADQGRQVERARLAARRRRDQGRAREARLERCAVPDSRRGADAVARRGPALEGRPRGVGQAARRRSPPTSAASSSAACAAIFPARSTPRSAR